MTQMGSLNGEDRGIMPRGTVFAPVCKSTNRCAKQGLNFD